MQKLKPLAARKPIEWKQLWLLARAELEADPSLDNLEWGERIKDQLVRAGFNYPERPEQIHDAMRAVEKVVHRTSLHPVVTPAPDPAPLSQTDEDRARCLRFVAEAKRIIARHTFA